MSNADQLRKFIPSPSRGGLGWGVLNISPPPSPLPEGGGLSERHYSI